MVFAEDDGGALVFGEGGDGGGDLLFDFALGNDVGWRWFVGLGSASEVIEWVGGMPLSPADPVEGGVAGDGEEPGGERSRGIVVVTMLVNADERILRGVLGVGLVVEDAMEEIQDGRLVPLHEDIERGVIATGKATHERGVGFLFLRVHAREWVSGRVYYGR